MDHGEAQNPICYHPVGVVHARFTTLETPDGDRAGRAQSPPPRR